MGNLISKIMDGLYKYNSNHEMKYFTKKSSDSYVSCTKRNAILSFCQKDSKTYADEFLTTFNEAAQSGNMYL